MTTTSSTGSTGTVSTDLLNAVNTRKATKTDATDQQSQFLTMLTEQLKNQDPMNPMDNSQMTSQLAQINMVDGINKVNTTLQSMISSIQSSEATQAAGLVGHAVLVSGSKLQLSQGNSLGGVSLDSGADKVVVSVLDASGNVVKTMDMGAQTAGSHTFTWDGKTDSGATAADGIYTLKVTATQGDKAVTANALQLGTVSSVVRGSSGVSLTVGQLGSFKLSDVQQILS